MNNKTILSGIKPTGRPHLGNYFGMMKQLIDMQKEYTTYAMIADYHALNFIQDGSIMRQSIQDLVIDYLALGFDTEKNILFKQSDIAQHTELAWIFDTITTMPYLKRAHAYKDMLAKQGEDEISVGTFNYPMLMASDILLYSPDLVPVGQDQKQHVEYARDTAEKFNRIFKEDIFKLPEAYILESVGTILGTNGLKMSKSRDNTISLFAEDEEIEKKVMSIVTDSSGERPENVFAIHALVRPKEELEVIYEENKGKYKMLKDMLIADLKAFIGPLREKRREIEAQTERIQSVLDNGKEKARAVAESKMHVVKKAIGVAE
jgi:tryptophanyl-tRNA synthetase